MLTISDEAATLIRSLIDDSDLPSSAGLRLVTDPVCNSLAMSLAPRPDKRDVVVTADGVSLFLSPTAANRLADSTLSAQLEQRKAFYFA